MKAMIDKDGYLHLERGHKMKAQTCPFRSNDQDGWCGDWCPLFDITVKEIPALHSHAAIHCSVTIALCQGRHIEAYPFKDERMTSPA